MTTFQLPTDDELLAELRAVGATVRADDPMLPVVLDVGTEAADAATVDAIASTYLRRIARLEADLAREDDVLARDVAALKARQALRTAARREDLERMRADVARLAVLQFNRGAFGKKKSRDVGGGRYGVKSSSARFTLDAEAFLPWAKVNRPDLVRVKLELSLEDARLYLTDAELEAARAKYDVLVSTVKDAQLDGGAPGTGWEPGATVGYAEPLPDGAA